MKKISLLVFLVTTVAFSQKNINNYKYVIVPSKLDFLKKQDQYQTSSLTKFLFKKLGFEVFLDNESLPSEVANNRCLALTGTVEDNSSMFTTKSIVKFKDCNNNVLFTSKEGKSKDKDYKKAYHESIRNAFKSLETLKYTYTPLVNESVPEVKEVIASVAPEDPKNATAIKNKNEVMLYAQPIENGFQLVNTTPEKVFVILKTNVKEVFVIKDKNGILYKNGSVWIAEYYESGEKISKTYQVKF